METNGLRSELTSNKFLCECCGQQVAKTGLFALPVIKDFNVFSNLLPTLFSSGETPMVNGFIFDGNPRSFPSERIPAIPSSAHRGIHAELFDQFLIIV